MAVAKTETNSSFVGFSLIRFKFIGFSFDTIYSAFRVTPRIEEQCSEAVVTAKLKRAILGEPCIVARKQAADRWDGSMLTSVVAGPSSNAARYDLAVTSRPVGQPWDIADPRYFARRIIGLH